MENFQPKGILVRNKPTGFVCFRSKMAKKSSAVPKRASSATLEGSKGATKKSKLTIPKDMRKKQDQPTIDSFFVMGEDRKKLTIPGEMRKKQEQPTIETFFVNGEERKNWQGFPLSKCYMEPPVSKIPNRYFKPEGYGQKFEVFYQSRGLAVPTASFCELCCLKPCIMEEEQEKYHGIAKAMFAAGETHGDIHNEILTMVQCSVSDLFGEDYACRNELWCTCVSEKFEAWFPYDGVNTEEDDEDEENVDCGEVEDVKHF